MTELRELWRVRFRMGSRQKLENSNTEDIRIRDPLNKKEAIGRNVEEKQEYMVGKFKEEVRVTLLKGLARLALRNFHVFLNVVIEKVISGSIKNNYPKLARVDRAEARWQQAWN